MNKRMRMLTTVAINRVVRERGRQAIHKMWRVGQEHDVIRIF